MKVNNINKKNLVGYWSLNSDSLYDTDIFQDLSGNGNNGTSANTPVYANDQAGTPNQAMVFNGTTDVVDCGSDTTIDDIFDSGGTVSAWIYPESDGEGSNGRIFYKRTSGWTLYLLGESAGKSTIRFWQDFDGTIGYWEISTIIPNSEWTNIVVNYNSDATTNNPIFYINGVPYTVASGLTEGSTPVGTRSSDAANNLIIGNKDDASNTFDGSISDAMLFSSTLTEDQVRQLYLSGRTTARMKVDASNDVVNGNFDTNTTSWSSGSGWTVSRETTIVHSGSGSLKVISDGTEYDVPTRITPQTYIAGHTYRLSGWVYIPSTNTGSATINPKLWMGTFEASGDKTITDQWQLVENTGTPSQAELRFVAGYGNDAGDTFYIDDIKFVDITNAVTPKLQKGLILDMPLAEPYTEASNTVTKDRTPQGNDGTVSGATIKYDGLVNGGDGIAYINQDKAYGTWEFDVGNVGNPFIGFINSNINSLDDEDGYKLMFLSIEALRFVKINSGGQISVFQTVDDYVEDNTDYRIKITRSLAGVFTVYIKGGTFGWDSWTTVDTATDTTYTTSSYFVADLDNDDTISNLKIDGKRISLSGAVQSTGNWTLTGDAYDFDGTNDLITIGNVGTTAKTISFWVSLDSTTESILEETDNVGISVSTGTMSYGSWDNCFIDGVDTDTITTGWHQVILTSTTDVDVSALRLGLVDTTYLDGQLSKVKVFNRVLSASDISYLYSKEVNLF